MAAIEVTQDCRSEQLRYLIKEHNKGVKFMEAVKKAFPSIELPELPQFINLKRREVK